MARVLGVCSWSLQPDSPEVLRDRIVQTGCSAVQLHLDPIREGAWEQAETQRLLDEAGIQIRSGMMTMLGEDYTSLESIQATGGVRPDSTWEANLAAAKDNARLARHLGLALVTFHAGWIPHDSGDQERATMLDRLKTLIDVFGEQGITVGLETGQESAATLLGVLEELPSARVNFDPANMLLYGMGDPHEALEQLRPRIAQLHAKDARTTHTPGTWGTEVPVGSGQVDWPRFFGIADRVCPDADVMIEREAGEQRVEDIRTARNLIEPLLHDPLADSAKGKA